MNVIGGQVVETNVIRHARQAENARSANHHLKCIHSYMQQYFIDRYQTSCSCFAYFARMFRYDRYYHYCVIQCPLLCMGMKMMQTRLCFILLIASSFTVALVFIRFMNEFFCFCLLKV